MRRSHRSLCGCIALWLACVVNGAFAARVRRKLSVAGAHRNEGADGDERKALEAKVDASLAVLRAALLDSGANAVEQFTQDLPKLVVEVRRKPATVQPQNATAGFHVEKSERNTCLFDDTLFSLTPEAKHALWQELEDPTTKAQIAHIRRGGWWSCARADGGQVCSCNGMVRLVDIDRTVLSQTQLDAATWNGNMMCDSTAFGVPAGAPYPHADGYRACECQYHVKADATSHDGFHLEKRLTSVSYLQEAWIYLLRLMGRLSLMPTGTRDRTYSGIENWAKRMPPAQMSSYPFQLFERYWITKYIRQAAPHIQGPKCLEWGNPSKPGQELLYASLVPGCTENYDMQFDKHYWQGTGMHLAGNIVHSDILNLPTVLGQLRMNAIFATQVFEHLADPHRAAQALFEAIAPGGVMVFTAPQHAAFHKVPHDYLRYTAEGAKYVLVNAGFCVPNNNFAGGGDFIMDIAMDAGLQVQDFPMEDIDATYQATYDKVSHSAIGIHTLAFKPPHAACQDPTAGWEEFARVGIRA